MFKLIKSELPEHRLRMPFTTQLLCSSSDVQVGMQSVESKSLIVNGNFRQGCALTAYLIVNIRLKSIILLKILLRLEACV